ncbi:K-dependent Na :Ca2 antiporter [Phaffia rhodozyma]|uniref:K-dependent Na: Ca2 antiporter n=1 Tax=Phaffia rhodozyma TaxID=264483 RepID=A0A0F7SVL1_PHARH|nr:K-dependent Na :Ca2 antiporter [Phaffia rhodozyma]
MTLSRPPVYVVLALVFTINLVLLANSYRHTAPDGLLVRRSSIPRSVLYEPPSSWLTKNTTVETSAFPFPGPPQDPSWPAWTVLPVLLSYTGLLLALLGMIAGEWLVPNLATLADALGLSDNTAGVTLLALGNGSPDVLSTYSAFTNDSGSLAIGELLGAATFIITVVVGLMAFVQPFKVHQGPFLRDVGFAIAAISLLLVVMKDEVLTLWEAGGLVGLYVSYVVWVVGGSWIMRLRGKGEIRLEEDEEQEAEDDLLDRDEEESLAGYRFPGGSHSNVRSRSNSAVSTTPSLLIDPSAPNSRKSSVDVSQFLHPSAALSVHSPSRHPTLRLETDNLSVDSRSSEPRHSPSGRRLSYSRPSHLRSSSAASVATFDVRRTKLSLLGAVEFRDVVNSLKNQASLEDIQIEGAKHLSPSIFTAGHYHPHIIHPPPGSRRVSTNSHHHYQHHRQHHSADMTSPSASQKSSYFSPQRQTIHRERAGSSPRRPSASLPRWMFGNTADDSAQQTPSVLSTPSFASESGVEEVNPWETEGNTPRSEVVSSLSSDRTIRPGNLPGSTREFKTLRPPSLAMSDRPSPLQNPSHLSQSIHTLEPPAPSPSSPLPPPSITLQESPSITPISLLRPTHQKIKRRKMIHIAKMTYHVLFPSLQSFKLKSVLGKVLSVLAVPAILALTLTLPVVDNLGRGATCCSVSDDEEEKEDEQEEPVAGGLTEGGMLIRVQEAESLESETGDGYTLSSRRPSWTPSRSRSRSPSPVSSPNALAAEVMHSKLLSLGEGIRPPPSSFGHSHNPSENGTPSDPSDPSQSHQHNHRHLQHTTHPIDREVEHGNQQGEGNAENEEHESEPDRLSRIEREMRCEEEDGMNALAFNKWLTITQCTLGPTFCGGVLFYDPDDTGFAVYPFIGFVIFGVILSGFTLVFAKDGKQPFWRIGRCLLGFSIAMIWIMALADEVVTVLTTMGRILGFSDAIIGLTVFAIGNSSADLVANLSIATFSPVMAFSACFGGPMLNILLGVGFSGAFVIVSTGKSYPVNIHPSLVTGVISLLLVLIITFIVVPLNGYYITKRWGAFLIAFYVLSMTVNVVAEVLWTAE